MLQYIIYTSAIYNKAIATSDTELIYNSVVFLFIMEMDKKIDILDDDFSSWVDTVTKRKEEKGEKKMRKRK